VEASSSQGRLEATSGTGRRYDRETQERAARLYQERRREYPVELARASRQRVGEPVDVRLETLGGLGGASRDRCRDPPRGGQ
jgi:hypothetical protein